MSLTIQAPHANMNGYEIGSDETRKNGVSDQRNNICWRPAVCPVYQ